MAIFLDRSFVRAAAESLPAGTMLMWPLASAPNGFLIRDGSSIAVADFPDLFAVLGYTFGGSGANFNLPDDRGLTLAGAGLGAALPGLTNHVLNSVFGEETHALTANENGSHTHVQDAHTHLQDSHTHVQDAHTHTQTAHTHVQNAHTHNSNPHTHIQDAHSHSISDPGHYHNSLLTSSFGGSQARFGASGTSYFTADINNGTRTYIQHMQAVGTGVSVASQIATNKVGTSIIDDQTAVNQDATAVNQNTIATNQATTATNQNATATNQTSGLGTAHNNIQPTRYYTPIIKY